eukprot:TRINITY_DN1883_c0_g1_i1.p1 TRINITY_DN1883_c0_g1~~TRINITY_DN1883_c0_g1_i1.p1  ORF type:complete len:125 (-),score=21.77 TRINITY_DN1883_c0_g1_i1:39-413(-)
MDFYPWKAVLQQCHANDISLEISCKAVVEFLKSKNRFHYTKVRRVYNEMSLLWKDQLNEIPRVLLTLVGSGSHRVECAKICKMLMDGEKKTKKKRGDLNRGVDPKVTLDYIPKKEKSYRPSTLR